MVEIRVLGPVEVWHAGKPLPLIRRQQRLIFGILSIQANTFVTCDELINLLWSDEPPPQQARGVTHSRISELRALLNAQIPVADAQIMTRTSSYQLRVLPDNVDAHRFRHLVTAGRDAEPVVARGHLREALALWRGQVLGEHVPSSVHAALCQDLESMRLTAVEDLFDIELRLGNHAQLADEIRRHAATHPSRERLVGQVMLALHRSGRTAESLHYYDTWRRRLADDLGIDPGPEVQQLHVAILQSNPDLLAVVTPQSTDAYGHVGLSSPETGARSGEASFTAAVPRLLPPDISDFTGREVEIGQIHDVLTRPGRESTGIVAISGIGGVGKTALSLHVAHGLHAAFPDGQLYVNLLGAGKDPVEPFEVVGRFLRALGVDGAALPDLPEERLDLYRDLTFDRRLIAVFDNAATDDQILPLIPAGPASAVIITSRSRLGTSAGAHRLHLDVLESSAAVALLSGIIGGHRVAAEPVSARELCGHCGHLPLAIRVVAARLAAKPHWSIRKLAGMLLDERRRLDYLMLGHLDVRASISLSYVDLDEDCRRLLRRLGDLDTSGISVWSAAAVLDVRLDRAEDLLEILFDAQLLDVTGQDLIGQPRYGMHDLVRLFARERAHADEQPDDLAAARARVYAAWLFVTDAAHRAVYGGDYHRIRGPAPRWTVDEHIVRQLTEEPLRWFESERPAIASVVRQAARDGNSPVCWELTTATSPMYETTRYFDEWYTILTSALAATQASGDVRGEAAVEFWIGNKHGDRTEYPRALRHLSRSVDLFQQIGDQHGQALATAYVGLMERYQGNHDAALALFTEAVEVLHDTGDRSAEAFILRNIAQIYLQRREYLTAEGHLRQALDMYEALGSQRGRAQTLFWTGMLHFHLGDLAEAETEFRTALDISRTIGDRAGEAQCLRGLGLCARQRGDLDTAMSVLSEALGIVRQPRPAFIEREIRRSIDELRAMAHG